jgi:hypothetical protein
VERSAVAAAGLAELGRRLIERGPFGSIRVRHADAELTTDHEGDPVVRVRLTVSDPPAGDSTWSLDDVDALRQETVRLAQEADADLPYVVLALYPETPDDERSEEEDEGELGRALDALDG